MQVKILYLQIDDNCLFSISLSRAAHHEGVDHWSQYGLQQQQHGAHWTLVGDDAVAVADGGLGLDGEEEGRDEAVDVVDARRPRLILQMVEITPWEEEKGGEWVWEKKGGRVTEWVSREGKIDRGREDLYF